MRRETEFGIIRNAGGRAADAVRSLVVLDALIPIGTVMVIHHTGMLLAQFRRNVSWGDAEGFDFKADWW